MSNVTLEIPVREGVSFSTPGKVTGGGSINPGTADPGATDPITGLLLNPATLLITSSSNPASVNGKATFGFTAKYESGNSSPTGNLTYNDHGADMRIKATSFGTLEITDSSACAGGEHATINGTAEVNGTSGHELRIEADDCDGLASGSGPDRFEIHVDESTPTEYSASGVLAGGNIQIHKS